MFVDNEDAKDLRWYSGGKFDDEKKKKKKERRKKNKSNKSISNYESARDN